MRNLSKNQCVAAFPIGARLPVAAPLPCRGGVPFGRGGVCNILIANKILTPPLPLPYKGGERLRDVLCWILSLFGLLKVGLYINKV